MTMLEMMKNSENAEARILEAAKKAHEAHEKLNAVVTFIDPAEQISNLNEYKDGLMYGIPVALKDNVNTKGIRTTASMYLSENPTKLQPRFDVIEIYAPDGVNSTHPQINHMEDAFQ